MVTNLKALHKDQAGPIIMPEELKNMHELKDSSIRTVTVTYAFFKLMHGLPKIKDPEAQAKEAGKLLQQLRDKTTLPTCIEEKLQSIVNRQEKLILTIAKLL